MLAILDELIQTTYCKLISGAPASLSFRFSNIVNASYSIKMYNAYKQVNDERYKILTDRYARFQDAMSDSSIGLVRVFDPLQKRSIDELQLIRDVSKDLQKKKLEEINKAAQAEAEAKKKQEKEAVEESVKEDA